MPEITSIILAAGKGKRMHSSLPKPLQQLCGAPLIDYSLKVAKEVGSKRILVVANGKKDDPVVNHVKPKSGIKIIHQKSQLGTGDAVKVCSKALQGFKGWVLILYGDVPLLKKETLKNFVGHVQKTSSTLGFVTAKLRDPTGYGRIIRDLSGNVQRVVEEGEVTPQEKKIKESNMGVYCVKADWLFATLKKLKPHPVSREYYLTDIIGEAIKEHQRTVGFLSDASEEFLGINTLKQLAIADQVMRGRFVEHWMARGVTFIDPKQTYLEATIQIGKGTIIYPQVYLQGKTKIGKNCLIEPGSILRDMIVADSVHIKPYSVLEESRVDKEAQIGPFARLRPLSHVGPKARVGNFVELKKTKLEAGVKANHLTYLGDARIGSGSNIGCGTITCNYDGKNKYQTRIGKKVFVGSDVQFVAPITVGDGAYIAAGSTITDNVPAKALAIARGKQTNKKGWKKKSKNQKPRSKTNPRS